MAFVFPQDAIEFLRSCQYDPAAHLGYELLSGGLMWSDERYKDFLKLCLSQGCHHYGALFAYRTSVIKEQPREEYRCVWEEVELRCPEWIGFRAERVTPSPELQEYLQKAEENFNHPGQSPEEGRRCERWRRWCCRSSSGCVQSMRRAEAWRWCDWQMIEQF